MFKISTLEAIFLKLMEKALQGDPRAAAQAIKYARELCFLSPAGFPGIDLEVLTDEELNVFEKLVRTTSISLRKVPK